MKKKKDKPLSVHDKAIWLLEGGSVEIDSNWFTLAVVEGDSTACEVCELDSICRMHHVDICAETDYIDRGKFGNTRSHYLVLCCQNR